MDRTDDPDQLELLLSTHHSDLATRLARRIPADLRGVVSGDDVAQEAALEAHRSFDTFRAVRDGCPRAWLWRIARNRLCDLVRGQRRLKRGGRAVAASDASLLDAVTAGDDCPARAACAAESRAALGRALATLPDACRRVVELRYTQGLSLPDTAARLGRTPGATAVLCTRALKLLRRALDSGAGGPARA